MSRPIDDLIRAARDWGIEEASQFSLPSTLAAHREEVEDLKEEIESARSTPAEALDERRLVQALKALHGDNVPLYARHVWTTPEEYAAKIIEMDRVRSPESDEAR